MIRQALTIAALAASLGAEAQASSITFSGSYEGGDSSLSFSGTASNSTHLGTVTVKYFDDFMTGPVFGTETITGPATFVQFPPPYGLGSEVFSVSIANTSSFGLNLYTDRTIASFSDPTIPISMTDLVSLNFTISNVPLPASAPMFGAALFCLGVVGYCMRRKMDVPSA